MKSLLDYIKPSVLMQRLLVHVIKDTLLRFNLKLNTCCGQCYDGASASASAMSGTKNGIAKILMRSLLLSIPIATGTH